MIFIGSSIILVITFHGSESYAPFTILIGFILLVSNALVFKSYLKNHRIAMETFVLIPCRKGILRKIRDHMVVCVRCFVAYILMLILMPITLITSHLGRHIWIESYNYFLTNQYGIFAYLILTISFMLSLPVHGMYTILTRKESDVLRAVTSTLFTISLFLLYALLAVEIFKA